VGVMAGAGLTARDPKSANQRTMRGLLVATRSAEKRQMTPNESVRLRRTTAAASSASEFFDCKCSV
jgi:hypothetical protein